MADEGIPTSKEGGVELQLLSLFESGNINGTTRAVVDRLWSYPESDYGPADTILLIGTREYDRQQEVG